MKHDDTPDTRPDHTARRPMSAVDEPLETVWHSFRIRENYGRHRNLGRDHRIAFMYVVLDGFDLGIGIVFPFFPDEKERDLMMNTVAPVWDGNETWLVLGGAGLFAVFPVVYSTVLSALYLPLIFMLVCLIFRGVSFEIRAKARRSCGISRSSAARPARRCSRGSRSARSCRAST